MTGRPILAILVAVTVGCNPAGRTGGGKDGGGGNGGQGDAGGGGGSGGSGGSGGWVPDGGFGSEVGPGGSTCNVVDDMDGKAGCDRRAPAGSFEPDIQWGWTPPGEPNSVVTPLVANLTDDNGDGVINLCDTPDVVLVAFAGFMSEGHIYVLDGATGKLHFKIAEDVNFVVTPAIGDIDGDGIPEIVTARSQGGILQTVLVAYEHDGQKKWQGTALKETFRGAVALADIDADGDVEILAGSAVLDHTGKTLWQTPESAHVIQVEGISATAAGDLDGDGKLEVVLGHAAYRADGSMFYVNKDVRPGFPQIANLDADPEPEILITNLSGISVLEHDGSTKLKDLRPTGDGTGGSEWARPAAVHDMDGDGKADFALSSANHYTVYRGDASIMWSAVVADLSGVAAGTAFDFLGDGVAEAMYADEQYMFVFDGKGSPLFKTPRTSGTYIEYPIVADIDNDGSAEIVVVSDGLHGGMPAPTIQVVRDKMDRWIQPRRIWNQHTYHVTNVREDGTIPQHEKPSWKFLNTFRTNAQITKGGVCRPMGTAGP